MIAENAWLIADRLGPSAEVGLRSVTYGGLHRVDLGDTDSDRAADLLETYADLNLGLVYASVVTVSERLRIITLATLNHRDFRVMRPRHCDSFELLP